jgi:hypothetical protein
MRIERIALLLLILACSENKSFSGSDKVKPVEPIIEPPPTCTDQSTTTGAHFMFLVDNSGSMEETDCPGHSGSRCTQQTNRETAILRAFDELQKIADKTSATTDQSTISIAKFTPESIGGSYSSMSKDELLAVEVEAANRSQVADHMLFTRRPIGDTPYLNAIEGARALRDNIDGRFGEDKKRRVAVIVTDGEPTDRNPKEVFDEASKLRDEGVYVMTIMVGEGSPAQRRARHETRMKGKSYEGRRGGWVDESYTSFEEYMDDLMNTSKTISNKVINIQTAGELESVIAKEIIKQTTVCK